MVLVQRDHPSLPQVGGTQFLFIGDKGIVILKTLAAPKMESS